MHTIVLVDDDRNLLNTIGDALESEGFAVRRYDSSTAALGSLSIEPSDTTTYEINGFVSTGAAGQAQIAALPSSTVTTVFGRDSTALEDSSGHPYSGLVNSANPTGEKPRRRPEDAVAKNGLYKA